MLGNHHPQPYYFYFSAASASLALRATWSRHLPTLAKLRPLFRECLSITFQLVKSSHHLTAWEDTTVGSSLSCVVDLVHITSQLSSLLLTYISEIREMKGVLTRILERIGKRPSQEI